MKSKHIPMSVEEYRLMSYPFGWKDEYWDGCAHLTPRQWNVRMKMALGRREADISLSLCGADLPLKAQMIEAFFETFCDSVEYCDWPTARIREHAAKNIGDYFAGVRGKPLPISTVALGPDGRELVGLALFVENAEGQAELDLLYVRPAHQGAGIATGMVATAANRLYEEGRGELYSAYHICNERSRDWHRKFGFREVPEQFYCRLKYSWYRHEAWRAEELGLKEDFEELSRRRDFWHAQLEDGWKY